MRESTVRLIDLEPSKLEINKVRARGGITFSGNKIAELCTHIQPSFIAHTLRSSRSLFIVGNVAATISIQFHGGLNSWRLIMRRGGVRGCNKPRGLDEFERLPGRWKEFWRFYLSSIPSYLPQKFKQWQCFHFDTFQDRLIFIYYLIQYSFRSSIPSIRLWFIFSVFFIFIVDSD